MQLQVAAVNKGWEASALASAARMLRNAGKTACVVLAHCAHSDEENVLLNSTQDWDGEEPHGRAKAELAEQTDRYSARMEAQDAGEEMPIPDTPNREDVEAGASWSMVGTQAALALTKENLRQALESALKCAAREPPKLISDEQKAALFAKIQEAMEECGGRLLETFRRFDKDRNGFVEVSELCNMLESMPRDGLPQLREEGHCAAV